jgi:hypothetical protein
MILKVPLFMAKFLALRNMKPDSECLKRDQTNEKGLEKVAYSSVRVGGMIVRITEERVRAGDRQLCGEYEETSRYLYPSTTYIDGPK